MYFRVISVVNIIEKKFQIGVKEWDLRAFGIG